MREAAGSTSSVLAALLRQYRQTAELTQEQLARRAGLSVRAITDLERGVRRFPYPDTLERLSEALQLAETDRAALKSAGYRRLRKVSHAENDRSQFGSLSAEPPTSFIGRKHELAAVLGLLTSEPPVARLLTLTGAPGTGKTRLAQHVVGQLTDGFAQVWFVPLASVRDPELIPNIIAQVLRVGESSTDPLIHRIIGFLKARPSVLVLDNFEHILAGAPVVTRLLEECALLRVLVTSRAPLRLSGEQELVVPPLPMPYAQPNQPIECLMESDAVKLFVARAQAVRIDFQLTEKTGPAVGEICRRLDGLPLAIELAAARSKVLSPQALVTRLGDRLSLLTAGPQDRPERQRTLRAALDWSYDLLSSAEQKLFRRLAIFVGGSTIESVNTVCNADGELQLDVVDGLAALVDQSLVQSETDAEGEPRFHMLETVRDYAWERLGGSADFEAIHKQHGAAFLGLAAAAQEELQSPRQNAWRDRLQREMPNLRAALRWSLDCGDVEPALRATAALWRFWWVRGFLSEGRRWLGLLLEHPNASAASSARANALFTAGMLAFYQRDRAAGRALHEECLELQRRFGNRGGISNALFGLGQVAFDGGDLDEARARHEEALTIRRELGDPIRIATSASNLGLVVHAQGDNSLARQLVEEALVLTRQMGDQRGIAGALFVLARIGTDSGDLAQVRERYRESWMIGKAVDDRWARGQVLSGLACLAVAEGQFTLALRLGGAAATASESSESALFLGWQDRVDRHMVRARKELGPAAATVALDHGRSEDTDALLREALAWDSDSCDDRIVSFSSSGPLGSHASPGMPLTRREREIARLVARGHTNRELASTLTIGERTVATHIEHILDKLGVRSRAQVAAWTAKHLTESDI